MKKIIHIILLISCSNLWAQTISPQVINSAGDHRQLGSSSIFITDNVGEPFTETFLNGGIILTQGFIQPEIIPVSGFTANVKGNNVSCLDKDDGDISITITNPSQITKYTYKYLWTPVNACPNNDCANLDSLKSGTYSVVIAVNYTTSMGSVKMDTIRPLPIVIGDSKEICKVKIYSGVSPNGDGINDIWIIENISEFPNNHVTIFNRWGEEVVDIKGYDNKTRSWPSNDLVNKLLPSTYFYIVDLGDGSKKIKGWVELIKN